MSRIWKKPVSIPSWVKVDIKDTSINISWPKWNLSKEYDPSFLSLSVSPSSILLSNVSTDKFWKAYHWLYRALVNNMLIWVSSWFEKKMQLVWVWFSLKIIWNKIIFSIWFSHPVEIDIPGWIEVKMDEKEKNLFFVRWIDKQAVNQFSAFLVSNKKPEPYKQKWIRVVWQYINKKQWKKTGKK